MIRMRDTMSASQLFLGAVVSPHPRQHPDSPGASVSLISPNHGSSPRAFPRTRSTWIAPYGSTSGLLSPFVRKPDVTPARVSADVALNLRVRSPCQPASLRVNSQIPYAKAPLVPFVAEKASHVPGGSRASEGTSAPLVAFSITNAYARWMIGVEPGAWVGRMKMITSPKSEYVRCPVARPSTHGTMSVGTTTSWTRTRSPVSITPMKLSVFECCMGRLSTTTMGGHTRV